MVEFNLDILGLVFAKMQTPSCQFMTTGRRQTGFTMCLPPDENVAQSAKATMVWSCVDQTARTAALGDCRDKLGTSVSALTTINTPFVLHTEQKRTTNRGVAHDAA